MTHYCLDLTTCRRFVLLTYLGDIVDSLTACESCDNCIWRPLETRKSLAIDATKPARDIAHIVRDIFARRPDESPYPTISHVLSVYFGENSVKLRFCGDITLDSFGKGARYKDRTDLIDQLFGILVHRRIIRGQAQASLYYLVPDLAMGNKMEPVILHVGVERIPAGLSEDDLPLLRDLVNIRHTLSLGQHCPASEIISTSCLGGIAQRKPQTPEEMISLAGLPADQAERYGRFFADAVARHSAAEELKSTELDFDRPES